MQVYFRAKELANDTTAPLTQYDPDVASKRTALVQDAATVFRAIAEDDVKIASAVIDWANCRAVYASLPSDVDTIMGLPGVLGFAEFSLDELVRMLAYLRLELGE